MDKWLLSLGYEHDRDKGLYRIVTEDTEKRVALFAHEGAGKVFMSEILDIPFPYYSTHFEQQHTGVHAILFYRVSDEYARARVLTHSSDSHLYREGLPSLHLYDGNRIKY